MVLFKVCEAIKGRVPTSSFLRVHSQTKKDARETTAAHHTTSTTDAALIQKLLQMETT